MKAKIIKTGEEITIIGISKEWGTAQYYGSDGIYRQRTFSDGEIEILDITENPINWEQRRYEIAKEVVAAYSTFEDFVFNRADEELARWSVRLADALIEELKKSKNEKL